MSCAFLFFLSCALHSRLQHRNVAALRNSFMGQDYSFLVFKYPKLWPDRAYDLSELVQVQWDVAGRMLRRESDDSSSGGTPGGLVSESLVRVLVRQLVEVVAYIHREGVSHRNISPGAPASKRASKQQQHQPPPR